MAKDFEITITVDDQASAVLDRMQRHLARMAGLDAESLLADITEPAMQDEEETRISPDQPPSCTEDASCESGDHTYTWPCDFAPGTGRLAR
jgi:hypothetical protein